MITADCPYRHGQLSLSELDQLRYLCPDRPIDSQCPTETALHSEVSRILIKIFAGESMLLIGIGFNELGEIVPFTSRD